MYLEIFFWTIVIYILLIFGLSLIFIPNLGWKRTFKGSVPKNILNDLEAIGKKYKTKEEVLDQVLKYKFNHFESKMFQQINEFPLLFRKDLTYLWNKGGYIHCHQQNLLIRYFLINTKRFNEEDVKMRITNCYCMIHQYLKVKVSNKWLNVDPFAIRLGQKNGTILKGSIENLF